MNLIYSSGYSICSFKRTAVIVETGGQLSHGTIIAREYSISAMINIPGLLAVLKLNESIVVDG